jgi:hypothetical protein
MPRSQGGAGLVLPCDAAGCLDWETEGVETEEGSTTHFDEWFPMIFLIPAKLVLRFLDQVDWAQWAAFFAGTAGVVLLIWSVVETVRDRLTSRIFGHVVVAALSVSFGFQAVDFLT